jgi:drug/metabolite transporter (DMT)-like permease
MMTNALLSQKSLDMSATMSRIPKSDPPIALFALMLGSVFWGLAWWPLKYFGQQGLDGHAIALTAYALVALISLPLIWRERHSWRAEWRFLLLIALLFGIANFLFTWSLMVGSVVRSMLLFFLLPAWGVIGGKLFLGEQIGTRRLLAVALCLIGVFTIVGGVEVFKTPLSFADAAAFIAGIAYTGAGIANRKAFDIPMVSRTLVAFVGCTSVALLGLLIHVPSIPTLSVSDWSLLMLYAFVWLIGGTLLTTYGVTFVPASRAAVMQVLELIVAMISAVLIGGEFLSIGEIIGAVMILSATFIEALSTQPEAR